MFNLQTTQALAHTLATPSQHRVSKKEEGEEEEVEDAYAPIRVMILRHHIPLLHDAVLLRQLGAGEGLVSQSAQQPTEPQTICRGKGRGQQDTHRLIARLPDLLPHQLAHPLARFVVAAVFGRQAGDYERHVCCCRRFLLELGLVYLDV